MTTLLDLTDTPNSYDEGKYLKSAAAGVIWSEIDHGELTGLVDDDHPQYHTDVRGDLRYSLLNHNHDGIYYAVSETDALLVGKSDVGHDHNDVYYTKPEIDGIVGTKADLIHTHDDRYYTEAEIDTALNNKSNVGHSHVESDITNLDKYTKLEVDNLISNVQNSVPFIYNGDVYFIDSTRGNKELGVAILEISAGAVLITNKYLKTCGGASMSNASIALPFNATLVGISASSDQNDKSWTAEIRKNGTTIVQESLTVTNSYENHSFTKNKDFNEGDRIQIYVNGVAIAYPHVTLYFRRKK